MHNRLYNSYLCCMLTCFTIAYSMSAHYTTRYYATCCYSPCAVIPHRITHRSGAVQAMCAPCCATTTCTMRLGTAHQYYISLLHDLPYAVVMHNIIRCHFGSSRIRHPQGCRIAAPSSVHRSFAVAPRRSFALLLAAGCVGTAQAGLGGEGELEPDPVRAWARSCTWSSVAVRS